MIQNESLNYYWGDLSFPLCLYFRDGAYSIKLNQYRTYSINRQSLVKTSYKLLVNRGAA